jgi:hypothetical protein
MNNGEIIIFLGAGASFDAGVPISSQMINNLEELIKDDRKDDGFSKYKNLYYCIKSGIQYGFGMSGKKKSDGINIEILVNTMDELIKSYDHPIYPFVGAWIPRLAELAGEEFKNIKNFRNLIMRQLGKWMDIPHSELCDYYCGLIKFQKELEHVLQIFTLNYDLAVEKQCDKHEVEYNRGFDKHIWGYRNFDKNDESSPSINLYKLHGSIDWESNENNVEEKEGIINKHAIIFGTSYKLQYLDPFLFLVYEFRRQTLESATKIINCIGYSFNDEHINGILSQALKNDKTKNIVSIQPLAKEDAYDGNEAKITKILENEKDRIRLKLELEDSDNIFVVNKGAKDFLENDISVDFYKQYSDNQDKPY